MLENKRGCKRSNGGKNKMQRPRNPLLAFLFIVARLLPWLVFLFRPGESITWHALCCWALLFCLLLIWVMSATQRRLAAVRRGLGRRMLHEAEEPEAVLQVLAVSIAIQE